uniref:hypothetical protein n=1 Tax=Actinacidiphila soli TaxID=2487275 RepID=UPI0013E2DD99
PPPPDRREPQDAGRPGEPGRSPDEARATMAAYRSGWLRGGGPEARDVRPERRALRVAGRREQTPATAQDRKDSPDTPSSEGDQG